MKPTAKTEPLLLAHVVWMDRYAGDVASIVPSSFNWKGVGHLQENSGEQFNFMPVDSVCRGYTPRIYVDKDGEYQSKTVNLKRIKGTAQGASVAPVTVVWTAMRPDTRERVVVGWYRGATVYREPKTSKEGRSYYFEAPAANCVLLRPEKRLFRITRAQDATDESGPGQDSIFYVEDKAPKLAKRLRAYIAKGDPEHTVTPASPTKSKQSGGSGAPKQPDIQKRLAVEKAALDAVEAALGHAWRVTDNSRDNLGWDLTATAKGKPELRIEVKGLSGMTPIVEVTPNEFNAMKAADMRDDEVRYVITIVTEALSDANRRLRAFAWQRRWVPFDLATAKFVKGGAERLKVTEIMAARLTIVDGSAA